MIVVSVEDPDTRRSARSGALAGNRVLDVSTLGPGPYATMLLADMGADVVSVVRPRSSAPDGPDPSSWFQRGKRSLEIDLRAEHGPELVRRLAVQCDVFLEGYRPGTMERRGLGPADLHALHPRLIYTRLTGWGQQGPYSGQAGHDINYIAVGGALGVLGEDAPVPPLNLLGDFASGSLLAVLGTVLALYERERTGIGQVVDAAMVDGAALLASSQLAELSRGEWRGRGRSVLSGVAPFYGVYRCADGRYFSVGAIEPKFYALLLAGLGQPDELCASQYDETLWPELRASFAACFATRTQAAWEDVFRHGDACAFPVRELDELTGDPHLAARGTVLPTSWPPGGVQAAPAPRLSGSPVVAPHGPRESGPDAVLSSFGVSRHDQERYTASGTLRAPAPSSA